jgi:hypothetical protein
MNNNSLKKELISLIENIQEEELLLLLKDEIIAHQNEIDITDGLSKKQMKELKKLSREPHAKDTISYHEYLQQTAG